MIDLNFLTNYTHQVGGWMTTQNQRHRKWKHEMDASVLYCVLSEIEGKNAKGKLFSQLAQESKEQASYWLPNPPIYTPGMKVKLLSKLMRTFGPHSFLDLLNAHEDARAFGLQNERSARSRAERGRRENPFSR